MLSQQSTSETATPSAAASKSLKFVGTFYAFVLGISLFSMLLIVFGVFSPTRAVVGGLAVGLPLHVLLQRTGICFMRQDWWLIAILLFAAFLRLDSYTYILGGQDQGSYAFISQHLTREGSVFLQDDMLSAARETGWEELYNRWNQYEIFHKPVVPGAYEGIHELGIYIQDLEQPRYVFQFYALHSAWLAISSAVFGHSSHAFILLPFALLSIVFLYRLVLWLSDGDLFAGRAAAFTFAVSPLHTFFTKFHVSEITLLVFMLGVFVCLSMLMERQGESEEQGLLQAWRAPVLVLFAALSAMFMFFAHISGFIFVPVLFLLLWGSILWLPKAKPFAVFSAGALLCYAISVAYGMHYSFPYSFDIYNASFSKLLGGHWKYGLVLFSAAAVLFSCLLFIARRRLEDKKDHLFAWGHRLSAAVLTLLVLFTIYQVYVDEQSIHKSSLLLLLEHSGFLGLPLFFGGCLLLFRKMQAKGTLFFVLACIFWVYGLILRKYHGYQYYFARYYLTSLYPVVILGMSLFLGYLAQKGRVLKAVSIALLILTCMPLLYTTIAHVKQEPLYDMYGGLKSIAEHVDGSDLMLTVVSSRNVNTSFRYYFGKNVVTIPSQTRLDEIPDAFYRRFSEVFLLSDRPLFMRHLAVVDAVNFEYDRMVHSQRLPVTSERRRIPLYLYRLERGSAALVLYPKQFKNKKGFYGDGIWTAGAAELHDIGYSAKKYIVLRSVGWHPKPRDISSLQLEILVNGIQAQPVKMLKDERSYVFQTPQGIQDVQTLQINSNTFVPKELGINNDGRKLGIDIYSVTLTDNLKD